MSNKNRQNSFILGFFMAVITYFLLMVCFGCCGKCRKELNQAKTQIKADELYERSLNEEIVELINNKIETKDIFSKLESLVNAASGQIKFMDSQVKGCKEELSNCRKDADEVDK